MHESQSQACSFGPHKAMREPLRVVKSSSVTESTNRILSSKALKGRYRSTGARMPADLFKSSVRALPFRPSSSSPGQFLSYNFLPHFQESNVHLDTHTQQRQCLVKILAGFHPLTTQLHRLPITRSPRMVGRFNHVY